jgi:23S rRNA (uracil1939-C5)-methyltransferase
VTEAHTIELRIDRLAAGGDGVARDAEGRVVFVPLSTPGDLLRVSITEARKRFARAEIREILEPGPDRTKPSCRHFGRCGGCSWQHVEYRQQLAAKAAIVEDALERIGGFELSEPIAVTPSPSPYGYRSRARLVQQGVRLGYRERHSHDVCVVDECPVLVPDLEAEVLRQRPEAPKHNRPRRRGHAADQPPGRSSEWELAIGTAGRPRAMRVTERATQRVNKSVNEGVNESAGAGFVELEVAGERLRVSHGVFAQSNSLLVETLHDAVLRQSGDASKAVSAVELYAGAGLFSLGLAARFDMLFAVEAHPAAVEDLRFNLERAGRSNVVVREGPVEQILPKLDVNRPDLLVLDPPRAGVSSQGLGSIAALAPERIVYLSCDPATLARDLAQLRGESYRLAHLEAFDLFPQTPHVEVLATLTRQRT